MQGEWRTKSEFSSGESMRRVRGSRPPYQTWRLFETEILTSTGFYITFYLADFFFFLMKCALHFATKRNSRGIQKCISFWVLSYDLFATACKAVFPAPSVTGVHRLRNTWSSQLSQLVDNYAYLRSRIQIHGKGPRNYNVQPRIVGVICHKKVQHSFPNQSLPAHPPPSKIPGSAPF